ARSACARRRRRWTRPGTPTPTDRAGRAAAAGNPGSWSVGYPTAPGANPPSPANLRVPRATVGCDPDTVGHRPGGGTEMPWPPPAEATSGRGLYLTRSLADAFSLETGRHGTTVRVAAAL